MKGKVTNSSMVSWSAISKTHRPETRGPEVLRRVRMGGFRCLTGPSAGSHKWPVNLLCSRVAHELWRDTEVSRVGSPLTDTTQHGSTLCGLKGGGANGASAAVLRQYALRHSATRASACSTTCRSTREQGFYTLAPRLDTQIP